MKKTISLMLVVVLCLSVFAACGTSAAVPSATAQASEIAAPSETTEASESATADVNAAELKTLTLFHHMGEEAKKSALQGVVDSFAANQAGLAIDAQFIDFGNYKNTLKVKIAAADVPDIMFGRVAQNSEMVSSGQIMDITGQKFLENFNAGAVGASSLGGKVYGIPVDLMATGVFYNKDVFEKAGVKVPTTTTEFYTLCETIQKAGIVPVSLGLKESWPVLMLYWCDLYGAMLNQYPDWRSEAMDRKITFAGTPEMKPAFEQIRKTYGFVNSDGWNVDYTKSLQAVATGEAAMAIYGSYCIPEIRKYSKDGNFGYFPLPTTDNAAGNVVSAGIDDGFMILEESAQKESALLFLDHMSKKEVAELWASTIQTISAVKDVTFDNADPMLADAISSINKGPIVLDGMTPMLAGEYDAEFTNTLIKFLLDPKISVDQLLKDLDATFDNIKAKS